MALNLPFGIQPINALANLDERYGPWTTCADALNATVGIRCVGLTVGVIESSAVVEYWFKTGINDIDLVVKNTTSSSGIGWSNLAGGSTVAGCGTMASGSTALCNTFYGVNAGKGITSGINNVGVGYNTLCINDRGNGNVAIGVNSMVANISGCTNVAIGSCVLYKNTIGNNNVAIGNQASNCNCTGVLNVAIGCQALFWNCIGSDNVAIGGESLVSLTSGSYNSALGHQSLYGTTTGQNNIGIGYFAGAGNQTGCHNIGIGANTIRSANSGSNNIALGCDTMYHNASGANNVALGNCALHNNTIGNYNVAIGFKSLFVNSSGNYNFSSGYDALCSNSSGCNNIAFGFQTLCKNTSASNNIGLGLGALASNIIGNDNIALGYQGLYLNCGACNIAFGSQAIYNNLSGNNNVGIGGQVLFYNSTGSGNIGIGCRAGYYIGTGNSNTFIGLDAGYWSRGSDNIAIGRLAIRGNDIIASTGTNNIGIGVATLFPITTGSYNVSIGEFALCDITTGYNNVAIGSYAGGGNGTGNVFIGNGAGRNEIASSKLHIGNTSYCSLIYGDFSNKYICIDNKLITCNLQVLSGVTAGYVLTADASGNATWQVGGGGGGITWSGSTATNGIGTYVNGNGICSNGNLTFNGSVLGLTGNLALTTGAARSITWNAAQAVTGYDLSIVGNGGNTGVGGKINICGGAGSTVGGDVYICGGTGTVDGEVYLLANTIQRLRTFPTGVCVTGLINASQSVYATTCVCSPIICSTTCVKTPVLQLTTVDAKTTETRIAYIKTDGTILSGTSAASGIVWSGSQANGVATYVDSSTVCSEPNMTFDGTSLGLTANIVFTNGGTRTICASTVDGSDTENSLIILGQCRASTAGGCFAAGDIILCGGTSIISATPAIGGNTFIYGGCGRGGANTAGSGGDVCIVGGDGSIVSGNGAGTGGGVFLFGGIGNGGGGTSTCGCVALHFGNTKVLHSLATGVCITGTMWSSTAMCSALACSTTCVQGATLCGTTAVYSPIICSSGLVDANTCVVIGTNIVLTSSPSASRIIEFDATSTGTGADLTMCGNNGANCVSVTASPGGTITIIAGSGGTNTVSGGGGAGGNVNICAGDGASGANASGSAGNINLVAGAGSSSGLITFQHGLTPTMCVSTGGIILDSATNKVFTWDVASTTIGRAFCIIGNIGLACTSANACAGGIVCMRAGTGGQAITSGIGGTGGAYVICGGCGGVGATTGGAGGSVCIVGGNGGTGGAGGADGSVSIITNSQNHLVANPNSNLALYYQGSVMLCTVSNGICLNTNCGFANDWVATSDCRLKRNIVNISNALSIITQLQGVCYNLCADCNCETRVGLIAQDVELVLPEIVSHSVPSADDIVMYKITDEKLGIKYDKLTAVLVEAIKEQQLQINILKEEIQELKKR